MVGSSGRALAVGPLAGSLRCWGSPGLAGLEGVLCGEVDWMVLERVSSASHHQGLVRCYPSGIL